jgi:hypothetical protein
VTAKTEVFDEVVRVEVNLPGILGMLAEVINTRIRAQATRMLEKK